MSDTDVPKINRWVNILFPNADWIDKNRNDRIDPDELRPAAYLSPSEKEKAKGEIKNIYAPVIQKIDKNLDGASYDEIKIYITPSINIKYDFDLDKVINGLKNAGKYKVPGQPFLFVTEDNLPVEIKEEVLKTNPLGNAGAEFLNYDLENGRYRWPNHDGKTKSAIILVSKAWMEGKAEIQLKWAIKHELLHAKQWFSGRMDEWDSIVNTMKKSAKFRDHADIRADLYETLYFPNVILEINANKDLLIEYLKTPELIEKKYIQSIQYICSEINRYLATTNYLIQLSGERFAFEAQSDLIRIMDEALPQKESNELNLYMNDLIKNDPKLKPKYHIYRDITMDQYNTLYDTKKKAVTNPSH